MHPCAHRHTHAHLLAHTHKHAHTHALTHACTHTYTRACVVPGAGSGASTARASSHVATSSRCARLAGSKGMVVPTPAASELSPYVPSSETRRAAGSAAAPARPRRGPSSTWTRVRQIQDAWPVSKSKLPPACSHRASVALVQLKRRPSSTWERVR